MPDSAAQFNEVFALTVDTAAFQEGLKQLQELYQQFLESLGDQAAGIIGVQVYQGIAQELQKLGDEVRLFNAENQQMADDAATSVQAALSKIDEMEEEAAAKRAARVKQNAEDLLAMEGQQPDAFGEPSYSTPNPRSEVALNAKRTRPGEEIDAAQISATAEYNKLLAQEAALQERVNNSRVRPGENVEAANVAAIAEYNRLLEQEIALLNKLQTMRVRPGEQAEAAQVAAIREYNSLLQKEAELKERIGAMRVRPGEGVEAAQVAALTEYNRLLKEESDLQEKIQAMRVRPGESTEAAQIRATAEYNALLERQAALQERLNNSRIRPGEQVDAAHSAAIDEDRKRTEDSIRSQRGLLGGLTEELGESAVRLARIYLLWNAINAVVQVFSEIVKAPFAAIAEGAKYLSDVNEQADKLTGVLHGNVQFSSNLTENFQRAGEAAKQVVVALRDISAKANLPFDQLERSFSASVDSGIVGTVHNLQEAVKLTELFALALQGAGNSSQSLRTLVSQLPLLFEGDVKSTSKLAEALHMSGDELASMVARAKEQRDLLEQLTPKLQPYVDAVKQAETHHINLVHQLEEAKNRLEGIAATQSFDRLNGLAQSLLEWLKKNEEKLIDLATVAGELAANLLDAAINAAKIFQAPGMSTAFKALGQLAVIVTGIIDLVAYGIRFVASAAPVVKAMFSGSKQEIADAAIAMGRIGKEAIDTAKELGRTFSDIAEGRPSKSPKEDQNKKDADELRVQLVAAQKARDAAVAAGDDKVAKAASNTAKQLQESIAQLESARSLFGDNSALTQPVDDKGNRPDLGKDHGQKDAKLSLQQRLAETKSLYTDLFEAVKRGEDSLNLTRAQSLAYLQQLGIREKQAINDAIDTYKASLDKKKLGQQAYNEAAIAAETERTNAIRAVTKATNSAEDSTNKKFDTVGASEVKNQYQQQILDAEDFYNKQDAVVKAGEANKSLSKRQGAALIAQAGELEKLLLDQALQNYKDNAEREVKNLNERNKSVKAAETEHNRLISGIDKRTDNATSAGASEGTEVDLIKLKADLAQRKQALLADFQFQQQLAKEGKTRDSELLLNKINLETAANKLEVGALESELAKYSSQTTEYARIQNELEAVWKKYTTDVIILSAERVQALQKEAQAAREHAIALKETQLQGSTIGSRIEHNAEEIPTLNTTPFDNERQILNLREQELRTQLAIKVANGETADAQSKIIQQLAQIRNQKLQILQEELQAIKSTNAPDTVKRSQSQQLIKPLINSEADAALKAAAAGDVEALKEHTNNISALNDALQSFDNSIANSLNNFEQKLLGFDLGAVLSSSVSATAKFVAVIDAAGNAMKNFGSIASSIMQGAKSGGVLGGVGAGLSSVGGLVPGPIGDIMSGVGSAFTFISSIFQQAAQNTANQIQKQTSAIMELFQTGQQSLQTTITQVTSERDLAVQKLSNEKGGQGLLDQILPGLNDQIESLKAQQLQILTSFNTQLANLNLQSDALSGIAQQWQQIVQTVAQYVGAGGSAATAQQYLQAQLAQISKNTTDQLRTANDTAVQDAINLNSLLLQRNQLELSYAQQQFSVETGDSIQRRTSIVGAALQMAALNAQHSQDLADINSQIDLETQKVAMESKVFNIATDINTLHQQDNALQLAALAEQLSEYQKMKQVVQDIANGTSLGTIFTSGLTPQQIGTLNSTLQTLIGVIQANTTAQQKGGSTGAPTSGSGQTAHAVVSSQVTTLLPDTSFLSTLNDTLLQVATYTKQPPISIGTVQVTVVAPSGANPATFGRALGNSLGTELQRRVRQGGR